MNFNDISLNNTYDSFDINMFPVLTETERNHSISNIIRPVPLLNIFQEQNIPPENMLENILLTQPMEEQVSTLFRHFFPDYNVLDDTLYEEPQFKNIISEEGKKDLQKIKYSKDEHHTTCPILLEDFKEGDDIVKLPCNHCFFPSAIKSWLEHEKAECPVCRYILKHIEIKNDTK